MTEENIPYIQMTVEEWQYLLTVIVDNTSLLDSHPRVERLCNRIADSCGLVIEKECPDEEEIIVDYEDTYTQRTQV